MICLDCRTEKPAAEFGSDPARIRGRHPYCKSCLNERAKVYSRAKLLEKLTADVADWTPEKIVSELDYLGQKLEIITTELRRRRAKHNG